RLALLDDRNRHARRTERLERALGIAIEIRWRRSKRRARDEQHSEPDELHRKPLHHFDPRRQLSSSLSNSAPPRTGSATGSPNRCDSLAISRRASASDNCDVLKLTPPQRIAGLVRRPIVRLRSIVYSTVGIGSSGWPMTKI